MTGLAVMVAVVAGCGPSEQAVAGDRESLRQGIATDVQVASALRPVDDLALKGKPDEAAAKLEADARPASRRSVEQVRALRAEATPWGQEHRRTLERLVSDRAASLDRYAKALRSNDLTAVVAALEEQQALERRASALLTAVQAPPSR